VLLVLNPVALVESALSIKDSSPLGLEKTNQLPRVLIVDDSPTTRSVLRGLFSAAGFHVTLASDGAEGYQIFSQQGADIVVTDIQMPRMDGFGMTRAIKGANASVPIILITGRESESDRRAGLDAGADAYVVKSNFEEADLIETVRRFL
jgi:two-component system chemotaxis sensor kinase CheA